MSTDENMRTYRRRRRMDRYQTVSNDTESSLTLEERVKKTEQKFINLVGKKDYRTIVFPTGERVEIPQFMSTEEIIEWLVATQGISTGRACGIVSAVGHMADDPKFRGKINGVAIDRVEKVLRINDIEPVKEPVSKVIRTNPLLDIKIAPKTPKKQVRLFPEVKAPKHVVYIESPEEIRKKQADINAIIANRYRNESRQERIEMQKRAEQAKKVEEQMNRSKEEEQKEKQTDRRFLIGCGSVLLAVSLAVSGMYQILVESSKRVWETDTGNLEPLVTSSFNNGIDFSQYKEPNNFEQVIEQPTMYQTLRPESTPYQIDGVEYQPFVIPEPTIGNSSNGLNKNSRLYQSLQTFSEDSINPVVVGAISSYQQFENLLKSDDDILYTSGPAYLADFSRQVVQNMLRDRYKTDRVIATYEKEGEADKGYEFHIRYYNGTSNSPTTMEGKVHMTRNESGRLETEDFHTFPMEVYEMLAMIGEFSNYKIESADGNAFDLQRYATEYTNGNIEAAKIDLKSKMEYGLECVKTILDERVRRDQIEALTYGRD